jgi:hypothetical protein
VVFWLATTLTDAGLDLMAHLLQCRVITEPVTLGLMLIVGMMASSMLGTLLGPR